MILLAIVDPLKVCCLAPLRFPLSSLAHNSPSSAGSKLGGCPRPLARPH
jgi:hypothetical protein